MRDLARRVPADPHRFVVDGHGDADGLRLGGGRRLDVDDLAHLIRNDPTWNGREVLLLSCRTGEGDFASQLSQRLGVPVVAPNGLAWSDGNGNVFASSGRPDADGRLRPGWPPNGAWNTHHPDGTTTPAGRDGYAPGHREGTRPGDDAEARGWRDWFRREGHVDPDGFRRFNTNEEGERYGENRLAHVYQNLPPQLQHAVYQYTVQSMPNPFLRPGADVAGYLNNLRLEDNYVRHLAALNGGSMPFHPDELRRMWSRPDLTDYQRQIIRHVLTQARPDLRLQEMWSNFGQREHLREYLGAEPTPDAFWRRINELDHALNQPLPEPVQALRGLHDVSFLRAADGNPLGGRHPLMLVGSMQSEPAYMSTSLGADTTQVDGQGFRYRLHLDVPAGSPGLWMGRSSAYDDQRELILQRGTSYYITGVTHTGFDENGFPVFDIQASVIPPGTMP
ncbi:ADP-ribosyltransferase [Actinomadura rubrisoli]|nr:ADP-ribosyltransferase [Actinomadura rubrisoli]